MCGVEGLLGGVQLVEHGADQGRLPDVLRDADPLRVGCAGYRLVGPVGEPDRPIALFGPGSKSGTNGSSR